MRCLCMGLALAASGCGVLFSEAPEADQTFDAPIDGLSQEQLKRFLAGDEAFGTIYDEAAGLGPVFNATSCSLCHPGEGRGNPSFHFVLFGVGDPRAPASFDFLLELGGPQLQDHAIQGYAPELLPEGAASSLRTGPIIVGLGLLEAVPAETILGLADATDSDGDGISGRANYVLPPDYMDAPEPCDCAGCLPSAQGCRLMGRFGRKATSIDLLHQAARALHEDIGITSDLFAEDVFNPLVGPGDDVPDPEVSASTLETIAFYLRTLRPPLRRDEADPTVQRGQGTFFSLGCAGCHIPTLTTGPSPIAPLDEVTIAPFTDLLLHDMGPALADGVPQGHAEGAEWRTTPLWGIGIIENNLGGETYYLHDGRARSLEEAVMLHGGEAEAARDGFVALPQDEREALLTFLRSL